MEKEKRKNVFVNTAKVIVSIGLIVFLVVRTDIRGMQKILVSANGWFLMLGVLLMLTELMLAAFRLYILLIMKSIRVPLFVLFKLNLMSVFVGTFLPSGLGVDALRIFYLSKHTPQVVDSISSVAFDRFLGMMAITLFAVAGFFMGGYFRTMPVLFVAILPMLIGIVFVFVFLSKKVRSHIGIFFTKIRLSEKVIKWCGDLVNSFYGCRAYPKFLFLLVGLALLFQVVRITTTYFFAKSLYIGAPYSYYFIRMPLVTILGLLPFAVAGFGITEVGSVYFFEVVGIDTESAFGFSLLLYAFRIVVTLPGLYFFYREGMDVLVKSASKANVLSLFKRSGSP